MKIGELQKELLIEVKVLYGFWLQAFSKKKVNDRKDWLNRAMENRKWRKQQGLPEVIESELL